MKAMYTCRWGLKKQNTNILTTLFFRKKFHQNWTASVYCYKTGRWQIFLKSRLNFQNPTLSSDWVGKNKKESKEALGKSRTPKQGSDVAKPKSLFYSCPHANSYNREFTYPPFGGIFERIVFWYYETAFMCGEWSKLLENIFVRWDALLTCGWGRSFTLTGMVRNKAWSDIVVRSSPKSVALASFTKSNLP